jgi:hypothetical protein
MEVLLGDIMVKSINVPHIRKCKACNNIKEIYAGDLCKKCYYRFYMRWWRSKNKENSINTQ